MPIDFHPVSDTRYINRRVYLSGIPPAVSLLVGCLSAPGGDTPAGGARISIADVDDPPGIPVRPTVEVAVPVATRSGPPRLRVTVTNTGDYPVEVGEEREVVFAFVHSEERPGAQLLPEPAGDYPAVGPGCWRLAEPVAVPEYYGIVPLAPGESTSRVNGVWGGPELDDGCLPTGRYRFEATYSVARDETGEIDEPGDEAEWGFEIEVERSA